MILVNNGIGILKTRCDESGMPVMDKIMTDIFMDYIIFSSDVNVIKMF